MKKKRHHKYHDPVSGKTKKPVRLFGLLTLIIAACVGGFVIIIYISMVKGAVNDSDYVRIIEGGVPTQVRATEPLTVSFLANDDFGLDVVVVWGLETGNRDLDQGRAFTCTQVLCIGSWPLTWTSRRSDTVTLLALALDLSGQESELARTSLQILPPLPVDIGPGDSRHQEQ